MSESEDHSADPTPSTLWAGLVQRAADRNPTSQNMPPQKRHIHHLQKRVDKDSELMEPNRGLTIGDFSEQQQMVIKHMLVDGMTGADAAKTMGVDQRTISTHLNRIEEKAGVRNYIELINYAIQAGWIALPQGEELARQIKLYQQLIPLQRKIAELTVQGFTQPQIGERIHRSSRAVTDQYSHLMAQLGFNTYDRRSLPILLAAIKRTPDLVEQISQQHHAKEKALLTQARYEPLEQSSLFGPQEKRVIQHVVCEGLSVEDTAQHIGITPKTVYSHLGHVRKKLGVSTQNELIRHAIGANWIALPQGNALENLIEHYRRLTPQQQKILEFSAEDTPHKAIGQQVWSTYSTVEKYYTRAMETLGLKGSDKRGLVIAIAAITRELAGETSADPLPSNSTQDENAAPSTAHGDKIRARQDNNASWAR